ncbi:hypothetical protein MASR1M36_15130 [Candidatus Cloacimonadaceae bacterium]
MKRILLLIVIGFILQGLMANDLDTALANMFGQCSQVEHNSLNFLLANDYLVSESEAYEYVAWNSALILCVMENWFESSYVSRLGSVDGVAAAWPTDYQDFVVSIPISEIRSQFKDGYFDDFDDLVAQLREYVDNYGDVGNLDNFED